MAAPAREAVIEVRGLVNRFGSQVVHDGVDLDVHRGEVLAVIGGSGAGKSVLLRSIIGLQQPAAGRIRVFGCDLSSASEAQRAEVEQRWGVMFQDGALFSSLTVLENVMVPMVEHQPLPRDLMEEIARLKIALVGLPADAGPKMPSQLSGGMRKRAGFARALVLDPEIVMFDEPDSGLDPVRTALLCELIKEVHAESGGCYMVISHDLGTARRIADFIAVLWKGRIVESGPKDELFESDNEFVHQFLQADVVGPLAMD